MEEFSGEYGQDLIDEPVASSGEQVDVHPECIRRWRIEFENRLNLKDSIESQKIASMEDQGLKELHNWAVQYRECLLRNIKESREHDKELRAQKDAMAKACESAANADVTQAAYWARVCQLCNFSSHFIEGRPDQSLKQTATKDTSRDLNRMRTLLLQLRQNPPMLRRQ